MIGTSMRRAMIVPATIATTRPSVISSAIRTSGRGSASALAPPAAEEHVPAKPWHGARNGQHRLTARIGPRRQRRTMQRLITAATCGSARQVLADLGTPGRDSASTSPLASTIYAIGNLADLGVA